MRAWNPPPPPAGWRSVQPPFVARESELRTILSAWVDVSRGSLRGFVIGGEPGSGKSRLIAEAAGQLIRSGAAVFTGSCVAEFGAPFEPLDAPLLSILDLVRGPGAGDRSSRLIRETIEPNPMVTADRIDRTDTEGAQAQGMLAAAIVHLLREAAERHPIVLVLDDLHWADRTALRLLPRLVSSLANSRVLILAGVRSTDPDRSTFADDIIAGLNRSRASGGSHSLR